MTQGDDKLHEIDTATHGRVHEVGVGDEPDAVAVAPGGTAGKGLALVANLDSNSVTPVDLGTFRAGKPIPVGTEPVAVAVSVTASGTATAFVADFGSNEVTPIDVATLQAGAPIAVGPGPQTIAAAPGEVLVGNFGNRTLTPSTRRRCAAGGAASRSRSTRPASWWRRRYHRLRLRGGGRRRGGCRRVDGRRAHCAARRGPGDRVERRRSTAWVTQQAGSLVPVSLTTGSVGAALHLGGHPSAIVVGAG